MAMPRVNARRNGPVSLGPSARTPASCPRGRSESLSGNAGRAGAGCVRDATGARWAFPSWASVAIATDGDGATALGARRSGLGSGPRGRDAVSAAVETRLSVRIPGYQGRRGSLPIDFMGPTQSGKRAERLLEKRAWECAHALHATSAAAEPCGADPASRDAFRHSVLPSVGKRPPEMPPLLDAAAWREPGAIGWRPGPGGQSLATRSGGSIANQERFRGVKALAPSRIPRGPGSVSATAGSWVSAPRSVQRDSRWSPPRRPGASPCGIRRCRPCSSRGPTRPRWRARAPGS